ncbi:MAG: apolipoprotein N-acyltransferase [Myxococcales bacterium]|nr:apolipoprotein N-acyltransferase [Myxococcales bacterium]
MNSPFVGPKPARIELRHRPTTAAVLGGLCFALTAPPINFHVGVPLGLAALFLASELPAGTPKGKRRAFFRGWLWATSAGLLGLRFVPAVVDRFTPLGVAGGLLALLLLAAFQALGWGLGTLLAWLLEARLRVDRRLAFPCGVLFACMWPGVFAWTPGALLSEWVPVIQLAEVVGERGLSFLMALGVACIAWPLRDRFREATPVPPGSRFHHPVVSVALGVGVWAALFGYGLLRLNALAAPEARVKVALIQPATDARLRWEPSQRMEILSRLRRVTVEAEAAGAELSIWPEAAYPFLLSPVAGHEPRGGRAIHINGVKGPVLLGTLTPARAPAGERPEGQYNAATLIDAQGHQQRVQAKLQLLWFGESLPFGAQSIPWLRKVFFRAGGLVPGDEVVLLTHPTQHGELRMAVLNCYEDILPAVGRRMAAEGPNLLVNVTNDAWFEGSIESALHLRLSVLRAVETRRDLVRAVNLGLPAWIDRSGRVRELGSPRPAGYTLVTPGMNNSSPTFYVRFGDYPLLTLLALLISLRGFRVARERRAQADAPQS